MCKRDKKGLRKIDLNLVMNFQKQAILQQEKFTIGIGSIAALYCVLITNMRPSILGQKFGTTFTLIVLLSLLFYFLVKQKLTLKHSKERITFLVFYLLMLFYTFFQLLFLSPDKVIDGFKVFIFLFLGFAPILILNGSTIKKFSKIYIYIIFVFGISYLVSYMLFFSGTTFIVGNIQLQMSETYIYSFDVLFPFSPIYNGPANLGGFKVPRAIGFAREPGLYQMMIIIAFWLQDYYKFNNNLFIKSILISSLLFTFSTTGYVILIITFGYKFIKTIKKINNWYLILIIPITILVLYVVIFSNNQFSISNKVYSGSGLMRIEATLTSLEIIRNNFLFGVGFHIRPEGIPIGINYLGTIAQLGFIGTIIYLMPFLYVLKKIYNKSYQFLNIYVVIILTMLLAQPLYDKPLTFLFTGILLLLSTNTAKDYKEGIMISKV